MFSIALPQHIKTENERGYKMQFALNDNGERINIKDAEKGKDYYCPCCNSVLVQKKGKIMVWHYAHTIQWLLQEVSENVL